MAYKTEPIPYRSENKDMTPGAIKKAFAATMASLPQRVETISRHLYESSGIKITPQSFDEEIDALPGLIARCGGTWNPRRLLAGERLMTEGEAWATSILGHDPGLTLTPETDEMVFDAALLWGELFRHRYPEARWAIGGRPKSSVDYGDPVLIGPYQYLSEVGLRFQLSGHVAIILFGKHDKWTLTSIMKLRAFSLGPAPIPLGESCLERVPRWL